MLNTRSKKACWVASAVLLVILSVQVAFLPRFLRNKVNEGIADSLIVTSNTSSGYDTWKSTTGKDAVVPWMECRFFNVTNVHELIHHGGWPQLQLTPPMVYNEMEVKFNVSFSQDKNWASYNTWEYYTRDAKRSYLDPKAEITIISPLLGALYYEEAWNTGFSEKLEALKLLSKNLKFVNISDILFWRGTAEDILFNIYHFNIPIHLYNPPILPPVWINETINFGLLGNGSNSSHDTHQTTNTGHSEEARIGEMAYYGKFGEYIDCWNPAYPLAPGHDNFFGINELTKGSEILAFVSTLNRNIVANFNKTYKWKGIDLFRYTVQSSPQFDTAKKYPPNAQFFQFYYSGLENLTNCSAGLPLFVSFPYFLGGEDILVNFSQRMGLRKPSWDTDLPYIEVEPITGAIFRANKSLQINTMIHSIPWIRNDTEYSEPYRNLPDDVIVPMIELSECVQLPDSAAKTFVSEVVNTRKYADTLEIAGYVSCGLLVVFCLATIFLYGKHHAAQKGGAINEPDKNRNLLGGD